MGNIISDEEGKRKVQQDILAVFQEIIHGLCHPTHEMRYDIDLLVVDAHGACLETPDALCQSFLDMDAKGMELDLFCAVVPTDTPLVVVQRQTFTGKPVRLSQLIPVATDWPVEEEYNRVMNGLASFITTITNVEDINSVRDALKQVIAARHHKPNTSQISLSQTIHAVLNFVQGSVFTLERDLVIFVHHDDVLLDSLALFNLIVEHSTPNTLFKLDLRGASIPYGWSPPGASGDEPIRLTDLVTHACTWTGGEDQQEAILGQVAGILASIAGDTDETHWYQALNACRDALHNTHLH